MPYEIKEDNGKYCVYKEGDSEPLGCHDTREEAEDQVKALYASDSHKTICFGSAVKMMDGDAPGRVGGYLVSFNGKDLQGEWFTSDTDFQLDWYDKRPALYQHGLDRTMQAKSIGVIDRIVADDEGIWAEAQLDLRNKYVKKVLELVQQGVLSWSSGSIPHLVKVDNGHIKLWPIIEGSLTPTPADPRDQLRIHSLKSLMEVVTVAEGQGDVSPDAKAHGNGSETQRDGDANESTNMEVKMTKEQIMDFAARFAAEFGVDAETATQVGEEVATEFPAPDAPAQDVEAAKALVTEIVDAIEGKFKAILANEAANSTASSYMEARIKAHRDTAEAISRVPVATKSSPVPDIQVSTKYAALDAEDMSYLASVARAVPGFYVTDQFRRELAHKAKKALSQGSIDLSHNEAAIKAIQIASDQSTAMKADEVMYSTLSGYGDDWVPELWSDQLWMKARQENVILPMVRVVEMPSDPYKMPIESGDPTVYYVPETKDESQLTLGTGNPIPDSQMGTSNVTLDASKLGLRVGFSSELVEDSIIPIIPQLRSQATRAMMDAVDHVILNADDTTSGNINLDGGTPAATAKYMSHSYGFRHTGLVDNSAANALTASNQRVTERLLRETRGKLPDRYASRNPRNLAFITNYSVYSTLLGMDSVMTVDKFGSYATILTGEIPMFDGVPILVTAELANTATNGKISSTAGNNVYGSLVCVYLPGWVVGYRRRITTRLDPVPGVDAFEMMMTLRFALTRFDATTVASLYYLDI